MSQVHTPASYYDPPIVLIVDEKCDGGDHDLDEHVYSVGGQLSCSECLRAGLLAHYRKAPANDLDEYPFEVVAAERCDNGCGMYRCGCPDER